MGINAMRWTYIILDGYILYEMGVPQFTAFVKYLIIFKKFLSFFYIIPQFYNKVK